MDDITRALLGDHEAAERITEQGELLPCPFCGKNAVLHIDGKKYFEYSIKEYIPLCNDTGCCGRIYKRFKTMTEAIRAWNTREKVDVVNEDRPD